MQRIEKRITVELENRNHLTTYEAQLRGLLQLQGKVNAFGSDRSDEFTVIRENGSTEGIFKTWAIPVIPFLEIGEIGKLNSLWPEITENAKNGINFQTTLETSSSPEAADCIETLDKWSHKNIESPNKFRASLESARIFSYMADRRLNEIYGKRDLPLDPKLKVAELVDRLTFAFSCTSPFYNLEALVGDPEGFKWNPIVVAQHDQVDDDMQGGKLDLYALTLPSFLSEDIAAEQLNWNNLSWQKLEVSARSLLEKDPDAKFIVEVSRLTETTPAEVVFAMNAMEWIPARVAGKKNDMSRNEALSILESANERDFLESQSVIHVGRDLNGLIRFLNWFPLNRKQDNFDNAAEWRYASVCDTTQLLLQTLIENSELFKEDFRGEFINKLVPQINNLDATSAKGRLLLNLILNENRLNDNVGRLIGSIERRDEIFNELIEKRKSESVIKLEDGMQPRMIVGGKAFGLQEVICNFPIEVNVPPGIVITSEAVDDILSMDKSLRTDIISLETEKDLDKKIEIAQIIQNKIMQIELPDYIKSSLLNEIDKLSSQEFAVRSSSWDEDGINGQTAAGIYESILNTKIEDLPLAVKRSVASFFSTNAINFRTLKKLSDIPHFAVLIQPMLKGIGGVAFSHNLHDDSNNGVLIEVGHAADSITSGGKHFDRYDSELSIGEKQNVAIDPEALKQIKKIVKKIGKLTSKGVDIEWVLSPDQKQLSLLQARSLPSPIGEKILYEKVSFSHVINESDGLELLEEVLISQEGKGEITLLGDRDLDAFQGDLFTLIVKFGNRIHSINTEVEVPLTSHFANICSSLGIRLNTKKHDK